MASERRRRSPPEAVERLLSVLAGEQEAPQQGPGLAGGEPVGPSGGLQHGSRRARRELLGVLGEKADLHVVADLQLAVLELPAPASVSIRVVLPAPLAPTSDTCSPRSSHISASWSNSLPPAARSTSSSSKTTRPLRSGGLKREFEPGPVARILGQPVDLGQLLDP